MQIFARSFKGLNLSPGERAFVKLVEGWLFTALATGVAIAYQLLATGSHDYSKIALVAGGAAGLTVLNSFKKYLAAQTDLPLTTASLATQATDLAIAEVQKVAPAAPAVNVPQFTTPVPQPAQFVQPPTASVPQFSYTATNTYPTLPTVAGQQ